MAIEWLRAASSGERLRLELVSDDDGSGRG